MTRWLDGNLKGTLSTRVGKFRVVFNMQNVTKQMEIQRIQYRVEDYKA